MAEVEYTTEIERQQAIDANGIENLREDHTHSDRSYLVFGPLPPPEIFDLSNPETRSVLKLIVDQLNVIRLNIGMSEITYSQAKNAIENEIKSETTTG